MAKYVLPGALDQTLQYLATCGNLLTVCSTSPATYVQSSSTYMLANTAVACTIYTLQNGASSGRRATLAAQNGVSVTNSGTACYVTIINSTTCTLLYVTTSASQVLTAGNTVNIGSWSIEIADPT